jgi:ubiquinone/menaquinone biosynthesis C-methylase UbiE
MVEKNFFGAKAGEILKWDRRNKYYHNDLAKIASFLIPTVKSVLEVGSGTGNLLAALKPSRGVGVDFSPKMMEIARARYPHLEFRVADAENPNLNEKFD